MTSGTGTKANFFIPELLTDALVAGFGNLKALEGTGAVIFNASMPYGEANVGEKINVPYFTNIGELDEITTDGDSLTERSISSAAEQASVRHFGALLGFTDWSRWAAGGGDPYVIASGQVNESIQRTADKLLIDAAAAPVSGNTNLKDVFSVGSPVKMSYDLAVDAKLMFGDDLSNIALLAVHSKVYGDLLKLKDGNDRPLMVDSFREGEFARFCGIPVITSDRLPVATSGGSSDTLASTSNPKYTSLVCKKGSLVFWMNGKPGVETDRKIERATSRAAVHVYAACHRYSKMPGATKPGVVVIKHNGPSLA